MPQQYGFEARQTFFRMGEVILELIGPDTSRWRAPAERPAGFFGLAYTVRDLDATAALLADHIGNVKDAVQPGRRITTLRHKDFGMSVATAFMSAGRRLDLIRVVRSRQGSCPARRSRTAWNGSCSHGRGELGRLGLDEEAHVVAAEVRRPRRLGATKRFGHRSSNGRSYGPFVHSQRSNLSTSSPDQRAEQFAEIVVARAGEVHRDRLGFERDLIGVVPHREHHRPPGRVDAALRVEADEAARPPARP